MGMQLAFYRMHNRSPATYESGATRQFLHGRTECVRVLTNETKQFVRVFSDFGKTDAEKYETLKKALQSHNKNMIDATNGKGVDRHLLGLRVMMKQGESHAMFKDPSYGASVNFELSTSNMSPGRAHLALGFGKASFMRICEDTHEPCE